MAVVDPARSIALANALAAELARFPVEPAKVTPQAIKHMFRQEAAKGHGVDQGRAAFQYGPRAAGGGE